MSTTIKKNNSHSSTQSQAAPKKQQYIDPRNQVIERSFEAVEEYCKSDPKTAKKIGGSILIGGGVGITVGGIVLVASSF